MYPPSNVSPLYFRLRETSYFSSSPRIRPGARDAVYEKGKIVTQTIFINMAVKPVCIKVIVVEHDLKIIVGLAIEEVILLGVVTSASGD